MFDPFIPPNFANLQKTSSFRTFRYMEVCLKFPLPCFLCRFSETSTVTSPLAKQVSRKRSFHVVLAIAFFVFQSSIFRLVNLQQKYILQNHPEMSFLWQVDFHQQWINESCRWKRRNRGVNWIRSLARRVSSENFAHWGGWSFVMLGSWVLDRTPFKPYSKP